MISDKTDLLSALGLGPATVQSADRDQLGQADFLRLLTTELRFQDPTAPLDSKDFLGQIAQFTSVDGIQGMQRALADMSQTVARTQTLQAAAVVGRQALVPVSQVLVTPGESIAGKVALDEAVRDLEVVVRDGAGAMVRRIALGAQQAGMVPFFWDGTTAEGGQAGAGIYSFAMRHAGVAGDVELPVHLWRSVESVSVGNAGSPQLHLNTGRPLRMDEVLEFA